MDNVLHRFPVGIRSFTPLDNLNNMTLEDYNRIANFSEFAANKVLNIILVGCGGTGGYVLAELLRIIGGAPAFIQDKVYLTAIDGDEFEAKNLARQLCTEDDLGMNKAIALTSNYGSYFGCRSDHITAIPEYLTSMSQLTSYVHGIPEYKRYARGTKNCNMAELGHPKDGHPVLTMGNEVYCANKALVEQNALNATTYQVNSPTLTFYNPVAGRRDPSNGLRCDSVTTIIIDCVDKNAPRKLISDFLEQSWTFNSIEEKFAAEMLNKQYGLFGNSLASLLRSKSILSVSGSQDYIRRDLNVLTYGNAGDTPVNLSTFESIPGFSYGNRNGSVAASRCFGENALMTPLRGGNDTYVISSGNGQYTGQVYWGRYCYELPGAYPTRYDDVWKDGEAHSSLLGRSDPHVEFARGKHYYLGSVEDLVNPHNQLLKHILEAKYSSGKEFEIAKAATADGNSIRGIDRLGIEGYRRIYGNTDGGSLMPHDVNGVPQAGNPIFRSFESFAASRISVPSPYVRFPELIDLAVDEQEDQMSCAERAEHNVQNIYANKTAAQLVINYFRTIFDSMFPISGNIPTPMNTAGVTFDIRTNAMIPEYITTDYLQRYDTINSVNQARMAEEAAKTEAV